jgi:DHA3 family macrolide efflux protein-like MFS transporter
METERQKASVTTFRNYLFLWIGQNISYLGSAIVAFIIILQLAGGENSVLSIAALLSFAPSILFGTIAGVFADRYNKKVIIIITDSLQAIATLALIILYYLQGEGNVPNWQIYIILGIRGTCQAFHGPVVSALTPLMVPKERLSRMNGIGYLLNSIIGIIGPVVGAFILFTLKINVRDSLWIDVITYAIAMIPLLFVIIPRVTVQENVKKNSFWMDLKEGFSIIWSITGAVSMMVVAMLMNMLLQPLSVLLPNYILVEFGQSEQILAWVSASFSLGIMAGGLITSVKKKWKNTTKWILAGLITIFAGYAILILPKILPSEFFYMIFGVNFLMGIMLPIANVLLITTMQKIIPPEKYGRVASLLMVLSGLATPIGMITSGFIADALQPVSGPLGGIGFTYLLSGVVGILITILSWFFSDWKKMGENEESGELDKNIEESTS